MSTSEFIEDLEMFLVEYKRRDNEIKRLKKALLLLVDGRITNRALYVQSILDGGIPEEVFDKLKVL